MHSQVNYKSYQLPRLYCKGRILGYKRGKHAQSPNQTLLSIENVNDIKSTEFYLGKRVAFVHRAKVARKLPGKGVSLLNKKQENGEIKKSCMRVIWGKIMRSHGNSGVVKAKFSSNLPPKTFGASCRIVSYLVFYLLRCSTQAVFN